MDKKLFEDKIKSSLQVMLYVYQTKYGRNTEPNISNLQITWFADNDKAVEVNFDTVYKFLIDDPDVGSYMRGLKNCDNQQYDFFTGIEIGEGGEFMKRFTPIEESDDMIGYFKYSDYEWGYGDGQCSATFSYAYSYWFE